MSGAHKLEKLHRYQSDQVRVIHLVRALNEAGWPPAAIRAFTGLGRSQVQRIFTREAWYWIAEDEEFYERLSRDLPWLRPWQKALLGALPAIAEEGLPLTAQSTPSLSLTAQSAKA